MIMSEPVPRSLSTAGNKATIAVVGAGVAGAMAAHRLRAAGHHPIVFEAGDYIGGRARTLRKNGFMFDTGAVGLLGSYTRTKDLAAEIGMSDQFLTLQPIGAIPRDGTLRPLDMSRPIRSFLSTDLYSVQSKLKLLKMVAHVWRLRKKLDYEQVDGLVPFDVETVQEYSLRELNQELYEYLTGVLVRGAWLAPAEEASVIQFLWTAKNFTPHMFSLIGGMNSLPINLLNGIEVKLNSTILNVDEAEGEVKVTYQDGEGQHTKSFDACVIAVPPSKALSVFPQMREGQKQYLQNIEYSRSVNVHFGLSKKPERPELYVMVPKRECADITTIFLDHLKAPDRAPPGKGIISVFLRAEWCRANYETDERKVLDDVIGMLGRYYGDLASTVEESVVQRWEHCALMVKPGIFSRMSAYYQSIDPNSRVQLAGDFIPFSSVNTAVVSGERAAMRLDSKLRDAIAKR
jgi:oxygen-dependent protoporphyrinogen oxidase